MYINCQLEWKTMAQFDSSRDKVLKDTNLLPPMTWRRDIRMANCKQMGEE